TGRARRCGWFDAVVVRYATVVNGFTSLAMTKLDVLDGCKELKVCTGYRYQGQMYRDMPADLQTLTDCEPVYKRFKGWSVSTSGATTYRSLPAEAKRYLQYIEDAAECPIDIISTGSKREATILLNNPLTIRSRKR
ncbi:adenylosuccinate synthase, partial [Klebsiella aerogenes]|uniref:adenylosuccinate synthetase n=1 Tax=Klebsiella aerogenes TaxID=548 RepID=UPI000FAA62D8